MRFAAKKLLQGLVLTTLASFAVLRYYQSQPFQQLNEVQLKHGEEIGLVRANNLPLGQPLVDRGGNGFVEAPRIDRNIQEFSDFESKHSHVESTIGEHRNGTLARLTARKKFQEPRSNLSQAPRIDSAKSRLSVFAHSSLQKATELSDVFIGVKTTQRYHRKRLDLLLDTWVALAREQTYFFTDGEDREYKNRIGDDHLINTNCSSKHTRQALCCKMAAIFDRFLLSNKRWFCHVDDDTYVNVYQLVRLLNSYQHTDDVYIGKPSLNHPIESIDRSNNMQKVSFWFATGGAGLCISRALALKMIPYASNGRFINTCGRIRLPDDVTLGFISEVLLKNKLIKSPLFNSHLQSLWMIKETNLDKQVTLSYSDNPKHKNQIFLQNPIFNNQEDPTRLRSFHCSIYPGSGHCPQERLNLR